MFNLIALLAGNWLTLRLPALPEQLQALAMLLPVCLVALMYRYLRIPACFLLGCLLSVAAVEVERELRPVLDGRTDMEVCGEVIGLPRRHSGNVRFMFKVTTGELDGSRLRVTWYRPTGMIEPGQRWRLPLRLRPASGSMNFGLFDYEQWLFARRIHATGYVRSGEAGTFLGSRASVDRARGWLRERLSQSLPPDHLGTFLALTLGDTSQLMPAHWDTLNATGTTHLLIVSGLHVGLIAGLVFAITRWLGVSLTVTIMTTLAATFAYAALSGWGLPVQRAFVMTAVFLGSQLIARHILLTRQFGVAILLVTLFDPLASLESGYWLSFGAVLALMLALSNRPLPVGRVARWLASAGRAQWVVFLALMPVLGFLHQRLPLGSIAVNLFAIPWVGICLVPSLLLGVIVLLAHEPVGQGLFAVSGFLTDILWRVLDQVARAGSVLPVPAVSWQQLLLALAGIAILLAPRGLLPRWPGMLLLALLPAGQVQLREDQLRVTFLDVGQGLSVMLETRGHVSIYDTGPAYGEAFSAARQFIVPTLRRRGWSGVQRLVLSHNDNDHAGGEHLLRREVAVHRVVRPDACRESWRADGVEFSAFSVAEADGSDNDNSCLLLVQTRWHRILLTGDIEAAAEHRLALRLRAPVSLISVPHHGSNTSSAPGLLNRLLPDVAVISAGYLNRFDHPDAAVVERYRRRSIGLFNTAHSGAVEFLFDRGRVIRRVAREQRPAIWRRVDADQGRLD